MEQEKALEVLTEAKNIISEYEQIKTNLLQNKKEKEKLKEEISKKSGFTGGFWGFIVCFILGDIISILNKGTEAITSIINIFQNKPEYFRYFIDSDTSRYYFNNIGDFPELDAIFVSFFLGIIGASIGSWLYTKIISLKSSSNSGTIYDKYLNPLELNKKNLKNEYDNFWNTEKTKNIKKYIPLDYMKEEIIVKFIEYIKMGNANNIEEAINLYKCINLGDIKDGENNFVSQLFSVHTNKFNKSGLNVWETLCLKLNLNWDEKQYIDELSIISNSHKEIAMQNINRDLFEVVTLRVLNLLENEERVIIYKDNGVFSQTGKVGELITNKRIFILKKQSIKYIAYKSIDSLHKTSIGGGWYFNANKDFEISNIGCTDYQLGIILSLICMYTRNCHKIGYKIKVLSD